MKINCKSFIFLPLKFYDKKKEEMVVFFFRICNCFAEGSKDCSEHTQKISCACVWWGRGGFPSPSFDSLILCRGVEPSLRKRGSLRDARLSDTSH